MKRFAALYAQLDATTSTTRRLEALVSYLRDAPPADAAWAVYFLAGGKPRQIAPTKVLRAAAYRAANVPEWLFEESYQAVGDLAETIALLLPERASANDDALATWVEQRLLPLRGQAPETIETQLLQMWAELDTLSRLVCNKLITGSLRVGVSRLTVVRALAAVSGVDVKVIAQRLMGYTDLRGQPDAAAFQALIAAAGDASTAHTGHPYPFFLAHPLVVEDDALDSVLGACHDWLVEWKWDGIRAQLVCRAGQCWIWSRGEELVTDRFPELATLSAALPEGTVLDGEIVVWREDRVQPFAALQKRLGRKHLTARLLADAPVVFLAYDVLEVDGRDIRTLAQAERRAQLETLVHRADHAALQLSPALTADSWAQFAALRAEARARGVEGLMLKARASTYGVGRTKGTGVWWKWKLDPMSVDAVLLYAQRGHGRRAGLYSDYTFAVWSAPPGTPDRKLVPFAKAYSGLSNTELAAVDAAIRKTTVATFGPVREVQPTLVFEIGFEGIARSTRHKSGVAVRFPRMLRWRTDKPVDQADTMDNLLALLGTEVIDA